MPKTILKYYSIFLISLRNHVVYIYDIIGFNAIYIIRVFVIILMLKAIYSLKASSYIWYSLQEVSWALIFVQALVTSKPKISDEVSHEIKSGEITKYLLNPISYIDYKFLEHLARFVYNLTIAISTWLVLWYLLLWGIETSFKWFLAWMILVFWAIFVNFFSYMLIGLSAFFNWDSDWIRSIYSSLEKLFAWNVLPIPMFPIFLQTFIFWSHFAYTWYTAGLIFVRYDTQVFLRYLLMEIIWSLFFYLACIIAYKKGLKKLVINWW
ncbi:MAG: ABC transporter permease protein [uncultured bacterium (gcode 4)]|uniref:ABC transporter permease protein n=1 Tax=uncultured bacterium (gcode 4) TaxID=1234023 RepID=K2GY90_9BACT|nr:MAG: ABC transporter permease protein [uncultured bacterium (gcode 4)]